MQTFRMLQTVVCVVQAAEENVLTAVDVKEEQINKPSCLSVHLGGRSVDINGEKCT